MHEWIIIIVSLIMSFFFSGSETAFVSVNRVRVEVWRRQKKRYMKILLPFLKQPETFLYTTLIGNNIFNIAFASFATIYFNRFLDPALTIALLTVVTLVFGEIIPKTLFRSLADWIIRKLVYPLKFFYYLFGPLIWLVSKVSEFLLSLLGYKHNELKNFFSTQDIEILLNESQAAVTLNDPVEGEFLSGVLTLKELWVRDAMVPRTEIVAVSEKSTLSSIIKTFKKYGYTKVPVYRDTLDNITGVAYLKELFLGPASFQDIIRPVMFVPETKRCSELLSEFRKNNVSIAIVIDEYGGTAGLITTEDLVEELFGEIEDEDDPQAVMLQQLDEHTYRVNARIEIDKLNETFDNRFPEGEYETLAGLILTHLGHVPRREEAFEYDNMKIVITSATRRKIQWVRIILQGE